MTGIAVFHPIIPSHKLPLLALSQALSKREQLSRVERWAQSGPEDAQVSGELKGFWSEVKKRLAEAHKTLMVLALHKVRSCFTCMVLLHPTFSLLSIHTLCLTIWGVDPDVMYQTSWFGSKRLHIKLLWQTHGHSSICSASPHYASAAVVLCFV